MVPSMIGSSRFLPKEFLRKAGSILPIRLALLVLAFMLIVIAGSLVLSLGGAACAAVREEAVTYRDGDTVMNGFIVYDDASRTKRPGIVIVHDWWGITKHMHAEARKYAGQGYTTLVADMYGNGKTVDNPKDAGDLLAALRKDPAKMHSLFNAAKETLSKHATVDASRMGAMGYSLGAQVVLEMARSGSDLKGVVAYYTARLDPLVSPAAAGKVKAKVLVLNGEADPNVKPESINAFKKEMAAAKIDYRYVSYPGAAHAFNDPEADAKGKQFNLPFAYNPDAAKKSTAEVVKFFKNIF